MNKKILLSLFFLTISFVFASPFNEKLSFEENEKLHSGELLIRNINIRKNI